MNAITFIKQHGVEKAREVVEGAPEGAELFSTSTYIKNAHSEGQKDFFAQWSEVVLGWINASADRDFIDEAIKLSDLKRLVESVGLVGKVGGISQAKAQVKQAHEHGYQTMSTPVEINGSMGMGCLYIDTLEKAIANYEAIGGEHV